MKSRQATLDEPSAPIVVLADDLSATPLPTVAEPATPAQASTNALERARAFAEPLGFKTLEAVPVSALRGDNILAPSANMP